MSPLAPTARIKWPNDLLVDGAKLAGILLERRQDAVIIGFGVNLAERPVGAASLGRAITPGALAKRLAAGFGAWLARWRGEGLPPVRAAWLAAAHPIGTALSTNDVQGSFDGLDESGALRLRLADGSLRLIHAGDIFLI